MKKGMVRFCYRKILDRTAAPGWDQDLWNDTYAELRMQAQVYNQDKKYRYLSELKKERPVAKSLDHLVSMAAIPYLKKLETVLPDIVNTSNEPFLKFQQFRFEVIESDLATIASHSIAISFYSERMIWIDTIGDILLLAEPAQDSAVLLTQQVQLKPFFSIYSFENESYD